MQVTAPAVNTWMGQRLAGQRAPSTRAAAAAARPSRPRRPSQPTSSTLRGRPLPVST